MAENCYVPNVGFLQDIVLEDPTLSSTGQTNDSCDDNTLMGLANAINKEQMTDASAIDGASSVPDAGSMEDTTLMNGVGEQLNTMMVDLQVEENVSCVESTVSEQHPSSVEDIDMLLDKCLLQALHTTVKDKDLPILGSILW